MNFKVLADLVDVFGMACFFLVLLMCFLFVFILSFDRVGYPPLFSQLSWFVFIFVASFWVTIRIKRIGEVRVK